jgi:ribose/xylose/arabinose/galactoside ABC-type transport system permease subunit
VSADTAPVVLATTRDRGRLLQLLQEYGIYGAIVLLIIIDVILSPGFFSLSNLNVQLTQMVPTLIVALGMAMVIGTEGIDLSVGAVIALAASVIPLYLGYGAAIAIVLALISGVISGLVAGAMVAFAKVQPIVATLSIMIGLRGVAVIVGGASAKPVFDPTIAYLGTGKILGLPVMFWLAVVLVAIVAFVVRKTTFGRQLVAIGDNRRASTLSGLPVRRVLLAVYIISGLTAAIAGVLLVGYGAESDPANYGLNYELMAITAVVVGGTPLSGGKIKVIGTVAGAFFMQLITASLVQRNVPTSYSQMVEAAIIIVAVYIARGRSSR